MTEAERGVYHERAAQRARERYDWESVTTQYEMLLEGLRPEGLRNDGLRK